MSNSEGLRPVHPGEILAEEFKRMGESTETAALSLGFPVDYIEKFLAGKVPIDWELAEALSEYFGTSRRFWINLQTNYSKACEQEEAEGESPRSL